MEHLVVSRLVLAGRIIAPVTLSHKDESIMIPYFTGTTFQTGTH